MFILVQNLSFSYDSRPVFSKLSLTFARGWTALIGPNGSGKSTLLKLITGELVPDSGAVSGTGLSSKAQVCPQDMEAAPDCFSDPDILNDPAFFSMASRLEIGDDWAERWGTLSGGEKKRCIIADALSRKPDVLILDEPANHIDGYTIALLYSELSRFSGVGIIVSHNMDFLNKLCTAAVILEPAPAGSNEGSRAVLIAANPAAALDALEQDENFQRERKQDLAALVKTVSRAQRDAVRVAEQEKKTRMSKSRLDKHDSDTRGKINKARLTGKDRTGGKKAAALESVLMQKRSELESIRVKGLRKTGAGLSGQKLERPVLYALPAGETGIAGNMMLLHHPALEIRHDARIVVSGDNGCGKTSLVEYMLSVINLPSHALWYLHQELSREDRDGALKKLQDLNNKERGAALSVVYRLGSEPEALLTTRSLSPGEARKLLFALAMLRGVSFIVLDEPTNHLDALAVAAFADAINDFSGAALIVTHDRFFAEKTGKTEWRIRRDGRNAYVETMEFGEMPERAPLERRVLRNGEKTVKEY
ncbi:MAG: ATP-binding cassette domain-containing protein [Treponema sp.]|jgi:ATPase subunit of ABC transporter with duplicated ATPase domains|nr:ATP-binding cassette domain-containing protein [Treponema sp.]